MVNIVLEKNGKLFPIWILKNFKKYVLPEVIVNDNDPCAEVFKNELTLYQKFISQYLNYDSPFKSLLVYHGVGSGKTNTAINVYNILYNYTSKWNVFLLIPASLHDDPWIKDLQTWLSANTKTKQLANIQFIHYDAPNADKQFLDSIKSVDQDNKNIFIIDEAHKFINNVYSNITTASGKKALSIYDYIKREKQENINTYVIMLSATPVINVPYEYALIFNLLRPDIFPTSESIFEEYFISTENFMSLSPDNKNMFQRRITGLVSYYIGATPDKYAKKNIYHKSLKMSPYQEEVYVQHLRSNKFQCICKC